MNLVELLAEQARLRPHAAAIIEGRAHSARVTTFAQLLRAAQQASALLTKSRIKPGDAVLIFQPMSAELYAALLGVMACGGTAMFLDPSAGLDHMEACCEMVQPKVLIAQDKAHLLRLRSAALRRIPHKFSIGWSVPGAVSWSRALTCKLREELFPADDTTSALITFTSGSTGKPKAAVRTHGFLLAQHRVLKRGIELMPGEVDLVTLPIFLLANLATGVTSVIPDADLRRVGEVKPAPVLQQILEHRVTRCSASPAFIQRLLEGAPLEPMALGTLQKIFLGGAPVFPRLLQALSAVAPDAKIHSVYGSTEAEPIAHIGSHELTSEDRRAMLGGRGLLTGKPVSDIELRIMSDRWGTPIENMDAAEFDRCCVAPGKVGEIVVSGDHVLPGYLNGQGDTETKFRVGNQRWHRTGDAGWIDDQGRLWLMGRCGAKIQRGDEVLWPFAVECAAQEQPGIHRAALVDYHGRRVLAVEPESGGEGVNYEHLKEAVSWAQLDEIVTVKRLPVDARHNAKIVYRELETLLAGEASRFTTRVRSRTDE